MTFSTREPDLSPLRFLQEKDIMQIQLDFDCRAGHESASTLEPNELTVGNYSFRRFGELL
jgi:hypothetical protein